MKKQTLLISTLLAIIVLAVTIWFLAKEKTSQENDLVVTPAEKPAIDFIDVTLDFYNAWLKAVKSPGVSPYQTGLATSSALSTSLSTKILEKKDRPTNEPDPVLCQITIPDKIGVETIYELADKAQVMITAKRSDSQRQAIVTLRIENNEWKISDIECTLGETLPEREFTFEKEGRLLKSVVPPLDSKYWHLVFEENGIFGHVTPLFFNNDSLCTDTTGKTAVCDPNRFMETVKAEVKGQMNEEGVEVKKLELLP